MSDAKEPKAAEQHLVQAETFRNTSKVYEVTVAVSAAAQEVLANVQPQFAQSVIEVDAYFQRAPTPVVKAISLTDNPADFESALGKKPDLAPAIVKGLAESELERRGKSSDFREKATLAVISGLIGAGIAGIGFLLLRYVFTATK